MATSLEEIADQVFLYTKKMESNAADGCHTIYVYSVSDW